MKPKIDTIAEGLRSILYEVMADGHTSDRAMAREFNRRGVPTARGGQWHHSTVHKLVRRVRADRFTWRERDVKITQSS